jgi:glycosyltransferase involved in cell wall biosynthesis
VLPVAAAFADWCNFDIIHDHTRFYSIVGSLNFEQKRQFLGEAKAVLMPIQWNDPLPTVALESLASGTPIVAWNRSSMGEIIEDGESGFLVSSIERWHQE